MKRRLKNGLPVLVLILAAAVMLSVYRASRAAPNGDEKRITVSVTHGDGGERQFDIETAAENLRGALEQEDLISGTEGAYGLFVETVDGETADMDAAEWWMFSKDGESLPTGVDDTLIADGDSYEITFTVGW